MKRGPKPKPVEARIWDKIEKVGDCWLYGPKRKTIQTPEGQQMVVRVLFGIKYSELLHASNEPRNTCGHRKCVNPDHHYLAPREAERYGGQIKPHALVIAEPPSDEEEIENVMWFVENREYASPEAFRDYWLNQDPPTRYELHHIEEAFRRLNRIEHSDRSSF